MSASGMYPRQFSGTDKGTTIRNPATALLCIDSEDRFADMDAQRDSSAGAGSALGNPYDFAINKNENLLSGFFTRLGVTEVVFPWFVPNINRRSNALRVYWDDGVTTLNDWIILDVGFYKPSALAAAVQAAVRALDPVFLNGFTIVYGTNNQNYFTYNTNNPAVSISFEPVTLANTSTLPTTALQTFWRSVDLKTTHQLFDLLGFTTDNIGFSAGPSHDGGYTFCQFTRYIDIVSTQLTYNQSLKDSSTSLVTRDVLCRIYLADSGSVYDVAPSSPSFCPFGCEPFTIYRDFATPKFINWLPNQNVPGSIKLTVYDDSGAVLDNDPANNFYAPRIYWSLTLQVSEN